MIKVENFSKVYKPRSKNAFWVKNVNFTVEKGSITAQALACARACPRSYRGTRCGGWARCRERTVR